MNKSHMLQLDPSIPVVVLRGDKTLSGEALGWFDYGKEDNLLWLVALDNGGEPWLVSNQHIRLHENYSIGRTRAKPSDHVDSPLARIVAKYDVSRWSLVEDQNKHLITLRSDICPPGLLTELQDAVYVGWKVEWEKV